MPQGVTVDPNMQPYTGQGSVPIEYGVHYDLGTGTPAETWQPPEGSPAPQAAAPDPWDTAVHQALTQKPSAQAKAATAGAIAPNSAPDPWDGAVKQAIAQPTALHVAGFVPRDFAPYVKTPYRFGGEDRCTGLDCSAFTRDVYLQHGIPLPRTADAQMNVNRGERITHINQLQPGDQIFFGGTQKGLRPDQASHTGIYVGNGQFVHESSAAGGFTVSNLPAYLQTVKSAKFLVAKRYTQDDATSPNRSYTPPAATAAQVPSVMTRPVPPTSPLPIPPDFRQKFLQPGDRSIPAMLADKLAALPQDKRTPDVSITTLGASAGVGGMNVGGRTVRLGDLSPAGQGYVLQRAHELAQEAQGIPQMYGPKTNQPEPNIVAQGVGAAGHAVGKLSAPVKLAIYEARKNLDPPTDPEDVAEHKRLDAIPLTKRLSEIADQDPFFPGRPATARFFNERAERGGIIPRGISSILHAGGEMMENPVTYGVAGLGSVARGAGGLTAAEMDASGMTGEEAAQAAAARQAASAGTVPTRLQRAARVGEAAAATGFTAQQAQGLTTDPSRIVKDPIGFLFDAAMTGLGGFGAMHAIRGMRVTTGGGTHADNGTIDLDHNGQAYVRTDNGHQAPLRGKNWELLRGKPQEAPATTAGGAETPAAAPQGSEQQAQVAKARQEGAGLLLKLTQFFGKDNPDELAAPYFQHTIEHVAEKYGVPAEDVSGLVQQARNAHANGATEHYTKGVQQADVEAILRRATGEEAQGGRPATKTGSMANAPSEGLAPVAGGGAPAPSELGPGTRGVNPVLFITHADTDYNVPGKERVGGGGQFGLNEHGHQEAQGFGSQTEEALGGKAGGVVSSTRLRAGQTALPIAMHHGVPLEARADFDPWHLGPTIEGKPESEVEGEIKRLTQNPTEVPEGGESYQQYTDRVKQGIARVQAEQAAGAPPRVFVTHSRTLDWIRGEYGPKAGSAAEQVTKNGTPTGDMLRFGPGQGGKWAATEIGKEEAKNAAATRQEQPSSEQQHIGVPQGQDLRGDEGQVRQEEGQQAGGRGGLEHGAQVQQEAQGGKAAGQVGEEPDQPLFQGPWQLTRADIVRLTQDLHTSVREGALASHHADVEKALAEGKPVPPEVLADYPDLAARARPQEAEQVAPFSIRRTETEGAAGTQAAAGAEGVEHGGSGIERTPSARSDVPLLRVSGSEMQTAAGRTTPADIPQSPEEWYAYRKGAIATDQLAQGTQSTSAPRMKAATRKQYLAAIAKDEAAHPEWKEAYERGEDAWSKRIASEQESASLTPSKSAEKTSEAPPAPRQAPTVRIDPSARPPMSTGNLLDLTEDQYVDHERARWGGSIPEDQLRAEYREHVEKERAKSQPATPLEAFQDAVKQGTPQEALQRLRDDARQRIMDRGKGRLTSGLDPLDLADYALLGATHIAEGAMNFGEWSNRMVADIGEHIAPHLDAIWKQAKVAYANHIQGALGESAPKLEEAVAQAKAVTSLKNAQAAEDRKALGLDALPDATRKKWDETIANAREQNLHTQRNADLSVQKASQGKPLTDEESAGIQLRMSDVKKDHADVLAQADKTHDPVTLALLRAHADALRTEYDSLSTAAKRTGTETARALAFRRSAIDEDYSLLPLLQRAKLQKGSELTETERARVTQMSQDMEALNKKITDLEGQATAKDERIKELMTQREISRMAREEAKQTRALKREDLLTQRKALSRQMQELLKPTRTEASLLPIPPDKLPAATKIAKEMAKNALQRGILKAEDIVADVHGALKDSIEGLTPRHVRDLISGYGQTSEMNKAPVEAALREAKRQMNLLSKLEDIQAGSRPEKTGLQREAVSAETAALQRQVNEAMKKAGFRQEPSTQTMLNRRQAQLQTQIDALTKRIDARDFARGRRSGSPAPTDAATQALMKQRDALRDEFNANAPKLARTDAQKNAAYRKQLQRDIDDLQGRLDRGDYNFPKRPETPLEQQTQALKDQRDQLKAKVQQEMAKLKKPDALDYVTGWQRFALLSRLTTMGKLGVSALGRGVTTPAEEAIGGALSYVPGMTKVAKLAPREGYASGAAELKALGEFFSKATAKDMGRKVGIPEVDPETGEKLPSGIGELQGKYGSAKDYSNLPAWMEMFGRIHDAIKTPAERAEFQRSVMKRGAAAIRQGLDPKDPKVNAQIAGAAYLDSQRAKFMQPNWATEWWSESLGNLAKNKGLQGKVAATAARLELPIVRVPTNFVSETGNYLGGSVNALFRSIVAKVHGEMTPENADAIMRAMKKQGVGAGLMLLGYFGGKAVKGGGYYVPGQKRQPEDLKPGEIQVFGHTLPVWASHVPALEAIQIGATIRRAMEAQPTTAEMLRGENKPLKATGQVAGGLAREVPFLEAPQRAGEAIGGIGKSGGMEALGKAGAEHLNTMNPGLVQEIAKWMDMSTERKARGGVETLEMGVPGLRSRVPTRGQADMEARMYRPRAHSYSHR